MTSDAQKNAQARKKFSAGEKKSRHAMEEFGPGKKEYILCPKGDAVYYRKSWHHASDFFLTKINPEKEKNIAFRLCPAHEMIKRKQCEGVVVLSRVPERFFGEAKNLIQNMGEQAFRTDVLNRVLTFTAKDGRIRLTTSENQLAQKIARKIERVFRPHLRSKDILRGKKGDAVRIEMRFK